MATRSSGGGGGSERGGHLAAIMREILFYSPSGTLVGIALGGLGATLGGLAYFLHLQNVIDARNLYRGLDSLEIKIRRKRGEGADTGDDALQEGDTAAAAAEPSGLALGAEEAEEGGVLIPPSAQPMYNLPVLNIPLPVLTVCFWSVSFLATSIFAYTRAKLRLQFK